MFCPRRKVLKETTTLGQGKSFGTKSHMKSDINEKSLLKTVPILSFITYSIDISSKYESSM